MSNLSNLFISQSFYGIINLENSLEPLSSASTDVQLQDGVGENIGLKILSGSNNFAFQSDVHVGNNLIVSGNTDLKGDVEVTGSVDISGSLRLHGDKVLSGSLDVLGSITASNSISTSQDIFAATASFDTINARKLNVTIESSSVIFSSGSNVLGDEPTDTQILSGSVFIPNVEYLAGNPVDTDTRINNLNASSASQEQSIDSLNSYTQSADVRFSTIGQVTSSLNSFTASQENINAGYNSFTQSTDVRLSNIETYTSSADLRFDAIQQVTESLQAYTSSADIRFSNLEITSASVNNSISLLNSYTQSNDTYINNLSASISGGQHIQDQRLDSLESFTGSLVTDFVSTTTFNDYTSSTDNRLYYLELNSGSQQVSIDNINLFTSSIQTEVDGLSAETASYARLDRDNDFSGSQIITGSVNGHVENISVASATASIDCSLGNFFTVTLPATNTELVATNVTPGQTISLRLQSQVNASMTYTDGSIKFPSGLEYVPSTTSSYDLVTFVSFDNNSLVGAALNTFNIS